MGGFYGSVQLRSEERDRVVAAMDSLAEELNFQCLVSPVLAGWIGVYPSDGGQSDRIAKAIAQAIGGVAWHVLVHDDSVLAYWLWRDGELIDVYLSCAGYFSDEDREAEEPLTGNPQLLAATVGGEAEQLKALLDRGNRAVFEVERLEKLGKLVGVKNLVASYEYLKDGETDGITGAKKFTELPQSEKKKRAAEKKAKRDQFKAFQKQGVLLHHEKQVEEPMGTLPRACNCTDGFLLFHSTLRNEAPVRVRHFRLPSLEEQVLPWPIVGHVTRVASDAAGRRVAVCLGTHIELWDAISGTKERDIPASEWTPDVKLSEDGRFAITLGRPGLRVFDAASGEELLADPELRQGDFSIDPSGKWIIGSYNGLRFKRVLDATWTEVPISLATVRPDLPALADELSAMEWQRIQLNERYNSLDLAADLDRPEHNLKVGLSRDGNWLWCGAARGLWVFRWSDLLVHGEDALATWWYPSCSWLSFANQCNYVYCIVEEDDGQAIRFSTLQGELFRMDLMTGDVCKLFQWPEGTPIDLFPSTDDSALGCISCLGFRYEERETRQEGTYWQIWDNQKLGAQGR